MSVSSWPGVLVLAALVCWALGALCFAAAGAVLLARTACRGRTARPTRTVWAVDRLSPRSGRWDTWGGPYDTEAEALADYAETIADPLRDRIGFRVVEIVTLYRLRVLRRPRPEPVPALDGDA